MSKDTKTLVLLDSHAIIHRAYHALPDFASSKGEPTGAIYGLGTMLLGIIEKFKPEYVVACYDLPQPTYRHIAYEAYKSGRKKTDENLVIQLKSSRRLFEAFGIPMYDLIGFEADDMLGTIVEQVIHGKVTGATPGYDLDGKKIRIVIASGDMDTVQLVEKNDVVVYTLKKGIKDIVIYDEKAVLERFGFAPEFLPDYKGLRGDPSDNIIGIVGVGEKTASILIQEFSTLEKMYELMDKNINEFRSRLKSIKITDRVADLLINGRDDALFSKTLATIRRDAPINFIFEGAEFKPNIEALDDLFRELEFRTLITKVKQIVLGESGPKINTYIPKIANNSEVNGKSQHVNSPQDLKYLKAIDLKNDTNTFQQNETKKIVEEKKTENESVEYYKDAEESTRQKLKLATWVLDSNKTNTTLEDVYVSTNEINPHIALNVLEKKINESGLSFVYKNIEIPLTPVLEHMFNDGVMIDVQYLKKLSGEYHLELTKLEQEIFVLSGVRFNIASPKQLSEVLYEKLGLGGKGSGTRIKKTAGGVKSTKESELEKLKDAHPVVEKVLEYRELAKLLGTYIDSFPNLIAKDDRLHAIFSQTGTTTGRMSSQDPNLQNIPIKSELGKRIRNAFTAPKGKKIVAIDYSQIELRIAAILSGDKNLIDIFKNGIDVHTGVASRVFKVNPEDVTKDMRRKAKVINFGILYGMGVSALRANLGQGVTNEVTREEAQNFYSEYFNTFNGIAIYLEEVKRNAAIFGYTKTLFGRRRYFEGIRSRLPFIRASAERMAINAPIQGTAADITKLATLAVYNKICVNPDKKTVLLMQIHDELVFEIDESVANEIAKEIEQIMVDVLKVSYEEYKKINIEQEGLESDSAVSTEQQVETNIQLVPITVSVSIGDNWGEMKSQ